MFSYSFFFFKINKFKRRSVRLREFIFHFNYIYYCWRKEWLIRLSKVMRLLWNAMDDHESWKTITHSKF